MIIKDFQNWLFESESTDDPISRLKAVKYLHSDGEINTTKYLKVAIPILKRLGKIVSPVEANVKVEDQDEPNPSYWSDWANSWRGQYGEQISLVVGTIDWAGGGNFKIELNTGLKCRMSFSQGEMTEEGLGKYKMDLRVYAGDHIFNSTTDDLMALGMEWSGSEEIVGHVLTWAVNKYGHHAIDNIVDSI